MSDVKKSGMSAYVFGLPRRRFGDGLLFGVTIVELTILAMFTPTFTIGDWVYVLQHLMVLAIALTRGGPQAQDNSLRVLLAVAVSYAYPYAQVIYLRWVPGMPAWPDIGLFLITFAACLSIFSLVALGRLFGVRPAWRGLVTAGPYRLVRHPMYLSYVLGDIGYNLQEWNAGTVLMVIVGWTSLIVRIRAEDRILSQDARWPAYAATVRYRLIPGLW